jgi:uncharacterized protein (TIGR00296 family)
MGLIVFNATRELCFFCFEILIGQLTRQPSHVVQSILESQGIPEHPCPLFVTWTSRGNLRGCIGTFQPQPLLSGLREYALRAALNDRRFTPIRASEIKSLECEVSLLHSFEKCRDSLDWELGIHGTIFQFEGHSATFLPEVPAEQKWTKEQTLHHLANKAGVGRKLSASDMEKVNLERYQSSRLRVGWQDYQDFLNSRQ